MDKYVLQTGGYWMADFFDCVDFSVVASLKNVLDTKEERTQIALTNIGVPAWLYKIKPGVYETNLGKFVSIRSGWLCVLPYDAVDLNDYNSSYGVPFTLTQDADITTSPYKIEFDDTCIFYRDPDTWKETPVEYLSVKDLNVPQMQTKLVESSNTDKPSLSQLLVDFREKNNLRMIDLGKRCGVGKTTISLIEKGRKIPDEAFLVTLANVLGVDIKYLHECMGDVRHPVTFEFAGASPELIDFIMVVKRAFDAGLPTEVITRLTQDIIREIYDYEIRNDN